MADTKVVLLLVVAAATTVPQPPMAPLAPVLGPPCGVSSVSVAGPLEPPALETEPFPLLLTVRHSGAGGVLRLQPDWARLVVRAGTELSLGGGGEVAWNATLVGEQFFLYTVEVVCGEGDRVVASFPVPVQRGKQDNTLAEVFQRVGERETFHLAEC
jgi:hypothetical protein